MVKDKDIKQFMLRHQPEVKNSGPFLKDIVRQIQANGNHRDDDDIDVPGE